MQHTPIQKILVQALQVHNAHDPKLVQVTARITVNGKSSEITTERGIGLIQLKNRTTGNMGQFIDNTADGEIKGMMHRDKYTGKKRNNYLPQTVFMAGRGMVR